MIRTKFEIIVEEYLHPDLPERFLAYFNDPKYKGTCELGASPAEAIKELAISLRVLELYCWLPE